MDEYDDPRLVAFAPVVAAHNLADLHAIAADTAVSDVLGELHTALGRAGAHGDEGAWSPSKHHRDITEPALSRPAPLSRAITGERMYRWWDSNPQALSDRAF